MRLEQPADLLEVQALLTELDSLLQLLRIDRVPLGVPNTASIRQRGRTASAVKGEPAVRAAQADAVLTPR